MAATDVTGLMLQILVLFVLARVLGWAATRLGQPSVVGELTAGIILGPSILNLVHPSEEALQFAAELGAVLLLFEVGLESKLRDMIAVGRSATLVAVIGIVASFALGYAGSVGISRIGWWGDEVIVHVFVGATLTATSVGITARVLAELNALQSPEARIILGAAVLDDVGGLLILAMVVSLAAGALTPVILVTKASIALGFLLVAVVAGVWLVTPLFDRLTSAVPELGRGAALAWALGLAVAASFAGLAPIVGAFAAGIVLSGSRDRAAVLDRLEPVTALFVPVFFGTIGALVDVRAALDEPLKVAGVVAILTALGIAGKLACGLGIVRGEAARLPVGIGMVPRGEVGLIFALFGLTKLGVEPWVYAALVLVVLVTTLVTPAWLAHAMRRHRQEAGLTRPSTRGD